MMAPQNKRLLRLLLLLFLLLSLSSLFLSPSNPSAQIQPRIRSLPIRGPNFTLVIKVLTFNRLSSLSRCLNSLSRAQYEINDKVHLHIFIDHFLQDSQSPDLDQRLNISKQILDFVDEFDWKFGEKFVHYRTSNAGLQAQWLEAWWPTSDHEFAFVVEDDLEVSPLYYRFLKALIFNYYYNATNFSPSIYGASLQRPRFVPGKHGNKMQLDGESRVFLYQLVGTWGQLLFPRPWKEFRLWYDTHKAKGMKPFLDGMIVPQFQSLSKLVKKVNFCSNFWSCCQLTDRINYLEVTNGWYKKLGEKIWTPWFIKFIHSRSYFNIYTNFLHERALSISHRDAGVNYGKTAGPDSRLMDENSLDFNLLELYRLKDLKWYDYCFREVVPNRILRSSNELGPVLQSVQKKKSVILVSLFRIPEIIVRNILCHFEWLNIQNYILVGPTSDFLIDLGRRGHPVIDTGHFSDFSKITNSMNFQDSTLELINEILVMATVAKKNLELGYSVWVGDGNMIPRSSDSFLDTFDHKNDFYIGKTSRLIFIRSSSTASKIWTDAFVFKIASAIDTLSKQSIPNAHIFFYSVEKLLKQQSINFKNIDEMHLCLELGTPLVNSTSFQRENKFTIWSSETKVDVIQKQLVNLSYWFLDADSSCSAVVCHPS